MQHIVLYFPEVTFPGEYSSGSETQIQGHWGFGGFINTTEGLGFCCPFPCAEDLTICKEQSSLNS